MRTMTRHATLRTAALAAALAASLPAAAADGTDMFVGWRYSNEFQDPNIGADVTKNVLQATVANRYSLGSNFLNVDVLVSNAYDPAAGATSNGAQEIYVTWRHQLSFTKAFKARVKKGIVRDVALTAGLDLNAKNTGFAPGKQAMVLGPTLNVNLPKGFLDVSALYYKEWNHSAFGTPSKNVSFDGTAMFNATWGVPISLGKGASSTFKGFGNVILPKGKDASGVGTETEVLVRTTWQIDVGQLAFGRKGLLSVGPGYELWYHKFGNPTPLPPAVAGGAARPNHTTSAPTIQAEIHF
jgi:hypothetical protein